MSLDPRRIALQGIGVGLTAIAMAVQGLLAVDQPVPTTAEAVIEYWVMGRMPKTLKRMRAEEALLLGRLYLT